MSIVIVFTKNDPIPWRDKLRKRLPDETIEIYPDVRDKDQVLFALCWKPEPEVLKLYPNLRVVQSLGAGVDHILKTQDLRNKILTRIVDENLSHDMWEYLLGTVLYYIKNFYRFKNYQSESQWRPHRYSTISETQVSILGLGEIGGYVARKFAETGFQVSGWSASRKSIHGVNTYEKDELDKFLNKSDILINILPLTPETTGFLNIQLFNRLKKGAYLINVGRGEHLVEEDLLAVLDSGQLSGAFLDVFTTEPLPSSHPFWKHKGITITPHVASLTNFESATELIADNFTRLKEGRELRNIVSLEKGY